MKKIIILLFLMGLGIVNVNADSYYVNALGVSFSKEQYDYFTEMYYDGYQEIMTQTDFDSFDNDYMNKNLVDSFYVIDINPITRATSISTPAKTLKISKTAMANSSRISTVLTWNSNPTVKSYDVMGSYLDGVSLIGSVTTKMQNNVGASTYSINKSSNNGFGTSIPLSGSSIRLSQTFTVSNGGTVYASYQHATSSISLNNSQNYTFSKNGFGQVFIFTSPALEIYDHMSGVYISV